MIKDCLVLDWVIFDIINDYGRIGVVLDELRSMFSEGLYEENIANICFCAGNIPKTRANSVIN